MNQTTPKVDLTSGEGEVHQGNHLGDQKLPETSSVKNGEQRKGQHNSTGKKSSGQETVATDHYMVEKILKHERRAKGTIFYYVKWKGYPDEDNSWVSERDFDDLAVIKKYQKSIRTKKRT